MKAYPFITAIIIFSLSGGCQKSASKSVKTEIYFFDLKTFFNTEASRLMLANKPIYKTVYVKNVPEKKLIKITNWASELSLFSQSDINKTAFKNSYRIKSTANKIVYTAKVSDVKTRSILIYLEQKKPVSITIINHQKNYIFETWETLYYATNTKYSIKKKQKLLFWDTDEYKIFGNFN
ncbi:MAG: hypothetical protein EAZ51_06115 [Sphingobacteriales bacterium]|nr:MAG: hypothetical protein EAZ64_06550 [Sphingobacteriales bacterium]TAF80375.1 MAG: hypothetical protein EAZ51_06115 [Sphingobacteriales bacterium]